MNDQIAYRKWPQYAHWYNKLWFSEKMKYNCGPAGIAPVTSGWYVVRPIMNLSGMGAGATKKWIEADDVTQVPLGYFWCEWFDGNQYSVTYEWVDWWWNPISSWAGSKNEDDLSKFYEWRRSSFLPEIDILFHEISSVRSINVEFIGDKPIEVHLRTSPDPDYDMLIPIWKNEEYLIDKYTNMGYTYVSSYDNADGFLETPRLGFMVK